MAKMTKAQQDLLRKCWDDVPLSEGEKLRVYDLPFNERSCLSMRAYSRRKAIEIDAEWDTDRQPS